MSTALLTILTMFPFIRTRQYWPYFEVDVRDFCDRKTCTYSGHYHYLNVSRQVLPLEESSWAGLWRHIPVQDTLPFDDSDELEQADDAYAVAVGK